MHAFIMRAHSVVLNQSEILDTIICASPPLGTIPPGTDPYMAGIAFH